ncbi:MAG: hypothetical protein LBF12_02290 [Christensenellaceae bacterium]|nr:hypothetical protein [Christensenellaceae bacterium]
MINILLSVPHSLINNWWLYHLFLILAIFFLVIILKISSRKPPLVEGKNYCSVALKHLKKILSTTDKGKIRMHIYASKNYLSSANEVFSQYIKDFGYVNLSDAITFISTCLTDLDTIIKNFSKPSIEEIRMQISNSIHLINNSNINNLVIK